MTADQEEHQKKYAKYYELNCEILSILQDMREYEERA